MPGTPRSSASCFTQRTQLVVQLGLGTCLVVER
jgi:hypothetical protein